MMYIDVANLTQKVVEDAVILGEIVYLHRKQGKNSRDKSIKSIFAAKIRTMFSELAFSVFEQSIKDYHVHDNIDHPVSNPYPKDKIEHLLYLKNWIDTVQWHFEDLIRDPNIDPVEALKLKRRIDAYNQE